MGASTPCGMKEDGGSSSGPAFATGDSFRPGPPGRAPGRGRELLGTSTVWAFPGKGLVREGATGWAVPRPCSLGASGLSRGKAGAGQPRCPPEELEGKGAPTLRPQIEVP